jgi:predicted metal-dependent hydrolase
MLNGHAVPYLLRRSARRSVGLQIGDNGLIVSAPKRLAHTEIERSLMTKAIWIQSRLAYWRQCQARSLSLENVLQKGLHIPLEGEQYQVVYLPQLKRCAINHHTRTITLNESPPAQQAQPEKLEALSKKVERLLRPHALELFANIGSELSERIRVPAFTTHLSSARCRWGSCNKKNEMRLNWRLVFYPRPIIEYVVAHEMAHLIEMNHSAAFWNVVQTIKPDFQQAHDFLSEMNPEKVPLL